MKKILPLAMAAWILSAFTANATSRTLLIYDTLSKPFSLLNEIAPIQMCLRHFDTRVETLADSKATSADLENANFIIVAGISGFPRLQPDVLAAL